MQQTVVCPNCGSQNSAGQQFCVSCGAHLPNQQGPASHTPIVTGVINPAQVAPPVQPIVPGMGLMSVVQQGPVEVKPTWGLAWGLFWRMIIINLLLGGTLFLAYMIVRLALGYNDVFGPW